MSEEQNRTENLEETKVMSESDVSSQPSPENDEKPVVEDITIVPISKVREDDIAVAADTQKKSPKAEKKTKKTEKQASTKTTKVKKEKLGFNWFFWICFLLLLVPVAYFGYLLYLASQETNTPVIGDRMETDINYKINVEDLPILTQKIQGLENVEKCEVNLIVETLRVSVDAKDDLDAQALKDLSVQVYDLVNETFPVETYFTQFLDFKQYDLEVMAYNNLEAEDCILIVLNKNSQMEQYMVADLTTAKSPETVKELEEEMEKARQEAENPPAEEPEGGSGEENPEGQTPAEDETTPGEETPSEADTPTEEVTGLDRTEIEKYARSAGGTYE